MKIDIEPGFGERRTTVETQFVEIAGFHFVDLDVGDLDPGVVSLSRYRLARDLRRGSVSVTVPIDWELSAEAAALIFGRPVAVPNEREGEADDFSIMEQAPCRECCPDVIVGEERCPCPCHHPNGEHPNGEG